MTLTTEVRIAWPVAAERLLDHVTTVAGGDPATVRRAQYAPGDPRWEGSTMVKERHEVWNEPMQGLKTWAWVQWGESLDVGDPEWPCPPALVVLTIDNPCGSMDGRSGREVQAFEILPAVVDWLDSEGVPRDRWYSPASRSLSTPHP